MALVTLQVSVIESSSCKTGRDAVTSITGITVVGKRIVKFAMHVITIALIHACDYYSIDPCM